MEYQKLGKHNKSVLLLILIPFIFCSCATALKIKKTEILNIDNNFSGVYQNSPEKSKSSNHVRNDKSELLSLFKLSRPNIDSVSISFTEDNILQISFKNGSLKKTEKFKGKFKNKGYYEFFFNKKNIQILPFIPIIYSNIYIDRIRIYLTIDGDLIIEKYWDHSGNIFILGSSHSGKIQNFFKKT
ncbi:hypothetical protein [Aquimarina latercula]|uniref:hypothetical protein n=1 Tax=Aquimarina latercula TaxID=987 RepID=UPI0003FD1720|nr:hypothetical protein [Aquimarina latercula]